jgi:endonuclease/exonuclease/phosphatase family metal-dependent hydrolase
VGVPLRVVSYNVHSLRDDPDALTAVVRRLDPDVLIVQEAPRRWRWRTRCARLAHLFGLYYAVGGLPSLGNLILTNLRVQVLESWCLRYPLTPGRHMRGAAFARCAVPGSAPFVIVGSHLSTYEGERPAQAELLLPALSVASDPVILGIDLNETENGALWSRFATDLVDAGGNGPDTFPAGGPDRRIDAVFVDRRIALERFEVIDWPETVRASDHLPLVADVAVPAR